MGSSIKGLVMNALNQYDALGAETAALDLARMFQTAGYGSEVEGFRPDIPTEDRGAEYFGLEEEEETVWVQDQFGGWNPFKAVAGAVSSVAKAASSVVNTAAKVPGISSIVAAPKAALNIARGANVASAVKGAMIPPELNVALKLARGGNVGQTLRDAVTEIPGLKTVARAGVAVSQGKNLRQIAEEAAIGAVPGGAAYKTTIRTAVDVARGGNVLKTAASRGIEYGQTQLPRSELAQRALSVGLNMARGGNVGKIVAREAEDVAEAALAKGRAKLAELRERARTVARQAALVPGVGTLAAAGLTAASAAFEGKDLRQIAEEAAIGAVPGGALYQSSIRAAIDVARGRNVFTSVANRGLEYGLSQLPIGNIAQRLTAQTTALANRAMPAVPPGFRQALIGPNGQIIFQ